MNGVVFRDWTKAGRTVVPARIERRYCPTDDAHWRVDEERCPVCQSPIKTSVYTLAPREEKPNA